MKNRAAHADAFHNVQGHELGFAMTATERGHSCPQQLQVYLPAQNIRSPSHAPLCCGQECPRSGCASGAPGVTRPTLRFLDSRHLQQLDSYWGHEPEKPKSWEIKNGCFRFRGRSKPKLINSEICVFEFVSFGFAWWFMDGRMGWEFAIVRLLTSAATFTLRGV